MLARAELAEGEKAEQWQYAEDFRELFEASHRGAGEMQARAEKAEAQVAGLKQDPAAPYVMASQTHFKSPEQARADYGFARPLSDAPKTRLSGLLAVSDDVSGQLDADDVRALLAENAALLARAEKAEARMKEERADADRFQVQVLGLMRRELELMRQLAEAKGCATARLVSRCQYCEECPPCACNPKPGEGQEGGQGNG